MQLLSQCEANLFETLHKIASYQISVQSFLCREEMFIETVHGSRLGCCNEMKFSNCKSSYCPDGSQQFSLLYNIWFGSQDMSLEELQNIDHGAYQQHNLE